MCIHCVCATKGICKHLRNPGIDFKKSIPPDYIGWRNRFLGTLNVYNFELWMILLAWLLLELKSPSRELFEEIFLKYNRVILFWFFFFFNVLYLTLLHLPPLRFHFVGECLDRTQDCCDFGIGSQHWARSHPLFEKIYFL